jgi:hypothetical protein
MLIAFWRPPTDSILYHFVVPQEGRKPLHFCIRPERYHSVNVKQPLKTLQFLASIGATWDAKCDELVSSGEAREEALALRICMALWSQELADGLPLTTIPVEVVERGAKSTQAYIDALEEHVDHGVASHGRC